MMYKFSVGKGYFTLHECHAEKLLIADGSLGIPDALIPLQPMEVIMTEGPALTSFLFLMNSGTIQSGGRGKP